jgi:hypothetical protein
MSAAAAVRAEWVKIRTVRSTGWSLLLTFALCAGLSLLFGLILRGGFDRMDQEARANFDPVLSGFYSLTLGQISLVGAWSNPIPRSSPTAASARGPDWASSSCGPRPRSPVASCCSAAGTREPRRPSARTTAMGGVPTQIDHISLGNLLDRCPD